MIDDFGTKPKSEIRKLAKVSTKAKKQFKELQKNPHKHLPDLYTPARYHYEDAVARRKALDKKAK